LFYAGVAFRASTQAAMLAISTQRDEEEDHVIYLFALALHGLTATLLSAALNHQRKFRSAGSLPAVLATPRHRAPSNLGRAINSGGAGGGVGARRSPSPAHSRMSPQGSKHSSQRSLLGGGGGGGGSGGAIGGAAGWWRDNCGAWEVSFVVLLVVFMISLLLNALLRAKTAPLNAYYWFFAAMFCVQRLPVVALVLKIVMARTSADGPTRRSKALLGFGIVTYLPMMLVPLLWPLLPAAHDCAFYAGSWLDFVNLLDLITMILFFAFCRAEFLRNMEECIWTTVSQIQDTFDFRRF
jgi:hypothetical protein